MDNSSEVSTVEPNNEPSASPNRGIEWGAMALGFVVGLVWFLSQQALMKLFIEYLNNSHPPFASTSWFEWVWGGMSFVLSFAYGLVIGFVVGYRARHHHYRFAIIVILVLFVVTLACSIFAYSRIPGAIATGFFTVINVLLMLISLILNVAGSLNGAYLAQSVKRNRRVRIQ
jgi:MFS family permease